MLRCRIAEFRNARGLSQAELGRRIGQALGLQVGLTGSAIGQYENNSRRPDPDTLWAIARELGVEPGDLYAEDGQAAASGE